MVANHGDVALGVELLAGGRSRHVANFPEDGAIEPGTIEFPHNRPGDPSVPVGIAPIQLILVIQSNRVRKRGRWIVATIPEFSFPSTCACSCASTQNEPSVTATRSTAHRGFRRAPIVPACRSTREDRAHVRPATGVPRAQRTQRSRNSACILQN